MERLDPRTCPHDYIYSEVMFGQHTGDHICNDCGMTFSYEERQEIDRRRATEMQVDPEA